MPERGRGKGRKEEKRKGEKERGQERNLERVCFQLQCPYFCTEGAI
jgi:hypothetical protein